MSIILMIAHPILIQAGNDAITVLDNHFVETMLGCTYLPIQHFHPCRIVLSQLLSDIEVAVSQRHLMAVDIHPVEIHTKGSQEYLAIMLAQIVVYGEDSFGFQFEKHRIYQLNDIITLQFGQK